MSLILVWRWTGHSKMKSYLVNKYLMYVVLLRASQCGMNVSVISLIFHLLLLFSLQLSTLNFSLLIFFALVSEWNNFRVHALMHISLRGAVEVPSSGGMENRWSRHNDWRVNKCALKDKLWGPQVGRTSSMERLVRHPLELLPEDTIWATIGQLLFFALQINDNAALLRGHQDTTLCSDHLNMFRGGIFEVFICILELICNNY